MGHHVGDALLVAVGQRLAGALRRTDTLARLGGDEFAVLLEDTTPERAVHVGHQLVRAVAEAYEHEALKLFPGVSAGISAFPATGSTGAELLRQADMAMYHAKRGRLGVCLFEDSINPESAQKLELLADFRSALGTDTAWRPTSSRSSMRRPGDSRPARRSFAGITRPPGCSRRSRSYRSSRPVACRATSPAGCFGTSWTSSRPGLRADVAIPIAVNLSAVDIADRRLMDWLLVRAGRTSASDCICSPSS